MNLDEYKSWYESLPAFWKRDRNEWYLSLELKNLYMQDQRKNGSRGCDIGEPSDKIKTPSTGMEQVPPELQKKMREYAKKLLKSSPKMKPERVKRKVAEYFKVNLI